MILAVLLALVAFGGAHSQDWGCLGPQPGAGTACASRLASPLVAPPYVAPVSRVSGELVLSSEFAAPWAVRCVTLPHGAGCQ